ncbi:hypothetical protein Hanom_Chr15g01406431 [Helianthus anomalus]
MSWFNLNYIFGELSDTQARLFQKAWWRGMLSLILTMGEEMMITRRRSCCFRPHHNESLLPDLNEFIVPSNDHGYGSPYYEASYVKIL